MSDLWSIVSLQEVGRIDRKTVRGTAISLLAEAAGLDLGIEQAGLRTAAAVEISDDAADTVEKSFPSLCSPVIRRSILEVPTRELSAPPA
ncbi:MAG: hypothetical protein WCG47_17690 [Dermatophilaceae bacterium]